MNKKLQFIMPLVLWANFALAQSVEGVITDRNGEPIIGATVVVKGSKIYAVTDIDGKFSFNPPATFPFSARISSTGFKVQDVQFFELPEELLKITLNDDNVLSE